LPYSGQIARELTDEMHRASVGLMTSVRDCLRLPWVETGLVMLCLFAAGCARKPATQGSASILQYRAEKDAFMRDDPQSPFKTEPAVAFAPLKYFPADSTWIFQSELHLYPEPKPVAILDTKGQRREGASYGFLTFTRDGQPYALTVYRLPGPVPGVYRYAIWFTDRTTGDSTYEVGRYLDFQKDDDPAHVYAIDFNLSYNPYCAYSPAYACPIPRKEDHLDLAIAAGEKKWHE
jgi:hypothetical protein